MSPIISSEAVCNHVVIKVGGALLESHDAASRFFKQISQIEHFLPVIVHGGGAQVQAMLTDLGFTSEKLDGVRVTPAEHMPVVAGVLAGTANKQLVALAQKEHCNAVGISVLDGNLIRSEIVSSALGCVGTPVQVDAKLLLDLLRNGWMPLVSSIGGDAKGNLLNINADHAAAAIAAELKCPLVLLSDVSSVLDENNHRIAQISHRNLATLIENKVIIDGMKVKVESAMETAAKTGEAVIIAGWKDNLSHIIQGQSGTQIVSQTGPLL